MQRPSRQAVLRYFRGESSLEEAKLMELFLAIGEDEEFINQCLLELSKEIHDSKESVLSASELERQWLKFEDLKAVRDTDDAKTVAAELFRSKPRKLKTRLYYGMVASLLIMALGVGVLYEYRKTNYSPTYITQTNETNATSKMVLPDSSILWLNAHTEIRYKEGFGASHRNIEVLNGEVYFDVVKHLTLPFEVSTPDFNTKVLGTAFVVSAYKELNYSRVQVTRGKVAVHAVDKVYAALTANQSVVYDNKTGKSDFETFDKVGFNPENNRLFLQDVSFEELSFRINNLLGYTIKTNSDKVKAGFYTAEIGTDDSIENVLEHLSWVNGGTYKVVGKEAFMF